MLAIFWVAGPWLNSKPWPSAGRLLVQPPFSFLLIARNAPEKIPVRFAVWSVIASHHVPFCVDSVALTETCTGDWDVNGNKLLVTHDKAVLASVLAEVKAYDVSVGVYARNPSEGGIGEINRAELPVDQPKTMEHGVAVEIAANNSLRVERHRWERPDRSRNIDENECAPAEEVPMPMKKIATDELHAYYIASIADAKTSEIGAGKVYGLKGSLAKYEGMPSNSVTVAPHDVSASVDPGNVGGTCARRINR